MAKSTPAALDEAKRLVTGSLSAVGRSASFPMGGDWNFTISGTFSATIRLERSFDGGTTWVPCSLSGTIVSFTGPATEIISEPEPQVLYSVNMVTWSSGTANWRASQ